MTEIGESSDEEDQEDSEGPPVSKLSSKTVRFIGTNINSNTRQELMVSS